MATEWTKRMLYFYDIFCAANLEFEFRFTPATTVPYVPSEQWLSFAATHRAAASDVGNRVRLLEAIGPVNPH